MLDPELPVVTIEDLGILRDVTEDDQGRVHVQITPTYSGCPAMETIRHDLVEALSGAGYQQVAVEFVLSPAWTTDWLTDEARAKLAAYGVAPPAARVADGPVPLTLSVRCPQCGSLDTRESSRFGSTACKSLWVCQSCREPFDHFKTPVSGHCDGHAALHPLRVAAIDELTDDSVAITFDVPDDLREDYAFRHGQHLSIRGGDDVRRSFSICTPPSSGVLRIGVKRLPGGAFSDGVVESLRVGDELEVMTPAGRFTTDLDPTAAKRYVAVAAGSGITPVLSIVAALLEGEPAARGHPRLRQPHQPLGDVPRRGPRPQGPVPRRGSRSSTSCPASSRTSSCCPAGSTPTGSATWSRPSGSATPTTGSCAGRSSS